jgi:hypothetical protein
MYRGLVVSGGVLAVFGAFLVITDLYVPMGVSSFGLPSLVTGVIMFVVGFWRPEPTPVEAEPGKKFCWYCMTQILIDLKECPNCSLPQYETKN